MGNSAWNPDGPLEDPLDLGWKTGFSAKYWWSSGECKDGCNETGDPSFTNVVQQINFTSPGDFQALAPSFPGERFSAQIEGKFAI